MIVFYVILPHIEILTWHDKCVDLFVINIIGLTLLLVLCSVVLFLGGKIHLANLWKWKWNLIIKKKHTYAPVTHLCVYVCRRGEEAGRVRLDINSYDCWAAIGRGRDKEVAPRSLSLYRDTKGSGPRRRACKECWEDGLPQQKAFKPFKPPLNGAQHRAVSAQPRQRSSTSSSGSLLEQTAALQLSSPPSSHKGGECNEWGRPVGTAGVRCRATQRALQLCAVIFEAKCRWWIGADDLRQLLLTLKFPRTVCFHWKHPDLD